MRVQAALLALMALGCDARAPEVSDDWFSDEADYDVTEYVPFTSEPYDFTGKNAIADLPIPGRNQFFFGEGDDPPDANCSDWMVNRELPMEITGIVTIHPRYYFKTSGCFENFDVDSDEKYYGSYFIEDASGGVFVMGDSKVAHFDMGDRVTLRVRGMKDSFEDSQMVNVHDVINIERGPEPISYKEPVGPLGEDVENTVVRVTGTVVTEATTFGEIYLEDDRGVRYKMNIDAELNRRGFGFPVGSELRVTGPVFHSFGEHVIIVMKVGQVCGLNDADHRAIPCEIQDEMGN